MSTESLLDTMFAVHGKRSMKGQFEEYLKIFDMLGIDKAEKLFNHVRDHEDRFPTIKQLWGIIKSIGLIEKKQDQLTAYDDCYYCGGVGYVPYLLSPKRNKRITNYNTEVYACKCSAGQNVPSHVRRYFETFNELQFKEKDDDSNYPQLVTYKQREYASRYHQEKVQENGKNKSRRNRQSSITLDEGKLREELEKITVRNIET